MENWISAYELINFNIQELSNSDRAMAWHMMKDYVSNTARRKRKDRIRLAKLEDMPQCKYWGYLERLQYNIKTGEAFYITGQDYRAEMAKLRYIFDRKLRKSRRDS